jgi:hypothetical protein
MPTSSAAGSSGSAPIAASSTTCVPSIALDGQRRLQAEDRIEAELGQIVAGAAQLFGDPLDDRPAGQRLHFGEEACLASSGPVSTRTVGVVTLAGSDTLGGVICSRAVARYSAGRMKSQISPTAAAARNTPRNTRSRRRLARRVSSP